MHHTVSPFAEEFRAIARAEKLRPSPRGAVLFYGSSSIRLWTTMTEDFAGTPVVNRGFGGSTLADCVQEMDWLVIPCQPRAIVLYAGDNDLDNGAEPAAVGQLFEEFERRLRAAIGAVPLAFISIKPSPAREHNLPNIRHANALVRQSIEARPAARFLDIYPAMIDPAGRAARQFFSDDQLHLNRAGYRLWATAVRGYLAELGLA